MADLRSIEQRERDLIRRELDAARADLDYAAADLKDSVNLPRRAKAAMARHPAAVAATAFGIGAVAIKLIPALLWKGKRTFFGRIMDHLARGAVGFVMPMATRAIAGKLLTRNNGGRN